MQLSFVDSHCHLSFKKFINHDGVLGENYSIKEIVKRATQSGINFILAIGTDLDDVEEHLEIVNSYKNISRTVGIHALSANEHLQKYSENEISDIILKHCSMSKTVGIGEIGLDYHYSKDNITVQKKLFLLQMDLATKCGLPIAVHSRDAESDTVDLIKQFPNIKGVIHCFTGSKEFAAKVLDLGFYISISGVITFKKSTELQEIVRYIPLKRLLIETDAPFLAPMPFRGKINEPAYVVHVAEKISQILGEPLEKISEQTSKNFFDLFTKAVLAVLLIISYYI